MNARLVLLSLAYNNIILRAYSELVCTSVCGASGWGVTKTEATFISLSACLQTFLTF